MKKKKSKDSRDPEVRSEDSPWKSRLTRMKAFQERNSKTWKRNERLLFGQVDEGDIENVYSFGWGLVKALETAIYVQNPEMIVEPYSDAKMELGRLLTRISNYDLDQMDLKSIGNIGLIDCFTCGYFAAIETVETDKVKVEDEAEEVERPEEQEFEARRIPPKDLYVDPHATRLDLADARYIAIATYPTISALRAEPEVYTDLPDELDDFPEASEASRAIGPDYAKSGESRPAGQKETDPDYKTICVWECHDNVSGKITYVTEYRKIEIGEVDQKIRYKIGRRRLYPVTVMAFHPAPKGWYPKPELDLIATQLETLNKLDAEIYRRAMTKWNKFAAIEGFVSDDQLAKITDPTVQDAVIEIAQDEIEKYTGAAQVHQFPNLRELIVPLQQPEPNKDQIAIREMCKQEIMDIVGYGPSDRAGLPRTRSAREAVAIKERQDARLAKRADGIADFYRMFGAKHLMTLQQAMVIDRYVRVFDAGANAAQYLRYSGDDIQGRFNFIVYAGTSGPRNLESKRTSEIQLFQTLTPLAQAGKIPVEPLVMRLAEAFQWRGVDALLRNYKPATVMLAKVLAAMNTTRVPPNALLEAASAVVQAVLTPEEIEMVKREIAGGGMEAGPGQAPAPKGVRGESDRSRAEVPVT